MRKASEFMELIHENIAELQLAERETARMYVEDVLEKAYNRLQEIKSTSFEPFAATIPDHINRKCVKELLNNNDFGVDFSDTEITIYFARH